MKPGSLLSLKRDKVNFKNKKFMLHVTHSQVSAVFFWGALFIAVLLTAVITAIIVARIKTKVNSRIK